jgi:hypothetical protein
VDIVNNLRLGQALARMQRGALTGVQLGGEHILEVSNKRVPIEEGTLERSGKVTSEVTETGARAAISYNTPYAVRQHEEMDYHHDKGRSAKFLELAMANAGKVSLSIAAQAVRNEMTGKA